MKYDVFISYSRKDTAIADKICSALEHQGLTYFIDRKGIGGGMEVSEVLAEAIMNSNIMLFLGSKNSYESKFTNNEVTFAFNKMAKGAIIPYIIDNSTLPNALEFTFSSINIRTIQEHPIETTLMQDLCHILKRKYTETNILNKQQTPDFLIDNNPQSSVEKKKNIPDSNYVTHVKPNPKKSTEKSIPTPNAKPSSKTTNKGMTIPGAPNSIKTNQGGSIEMRKALEEKLYRQLGMSDNAKNTERSNRKNSSTWWKLFYFLFDFSEVSILNYLITLISFVVLIMFMHFTGYFNSHPFLISEILITALISYVGMRCALNLGLVTDESEEITNFIKGVFIGPFVVMLSPFWSLLIGISLWWLSYHLFNFKLFHSAGILYLYFLTACFTLITLMHTLYKRKKKHSR